MIWALAPTAGTKPQPSPPLHVPSKPWRDSAVIDIASVIDVEDVDLSAVFVDRVADPVFPAPCAPVPFEGGSQRCADSVRFLGQRAADELVTGPRDSLRQPLLQLPGSRGRDHDVVSHGSAQAEALRQRLLHLVKRHAFPSCDLLLGPGDPLLGGGVG